MRWCVVHRCSRGADRVQAGAGKLCASGLIQLVGRRASQESHASIVHGSHSSAPYICVSCLVDYNVGALGSARSVTW